MLLAAALPGWVVPLVAAVTAFGLSLAVVFGAPAILRELNRRKLEGVPARISLKPLLKIKWHDGTLMGNLASPLTYRGFKDGGSYSVPELPNLGIQLLINADESALAVIYEHSKTGHWVDVFSFFTDGTTAAYSTDNRPIVVRPGHFRVNAAGLNPGALLTRLKLERPKKPLKPVTIENADKLFVDWYADETAWRKSSNKPPIAFAFDKHTVPMLQRLGA